LVVESVITDDSKHNMAEFPKPASGSALAACGFASNPTYEQAVRQLKELSIMPPGYEVYTKKARTILERFQPRRSLDQCDSSEVVIVPDDSVEAKITFFEESKRLPFPLDSSVVHLQSSALAVLKFIVEQREKMPQWRLHQMRELDAVERALRPLSQAMLKQQPSHVRWTSCGDHPAFLAAMIDAIDWPDKKFVLFQCIKGFPIMGVSQPTGIWPLKSEKRMQEDARKFVKGSPWSKAENIAWNEQLMATLSASYHRAVKKQDSKPELLEAINATWEASMKEVTMKKSAEGPFSRSEMDAKFGAGNYRAVKRFSILQGNKYRPVDDATENGLNGRYLTSESVQMMPGDWLAAIATVARAVMKEKGLATADMLFGGYSDDESNAYRHSPTDSPHLAIVALVNPATGKTVFFCIRGHNFGVAAAVVNYCRKSALFTELCRRFLGVLVHNYVDDFTCADLLASKGTEVAMRSGQMLAVGSSQGALHYMAIKLNVSLTREPGKMVPWRVDPTSCGVQTDLSRWSTHGIINMRVKESSRVKVIAMVTDVLQRGHVSVSLAESITGKLRYVMGCMGRVGLAATNPLTKFCHCGESGERPISAPLFASLRFILSLLRGQLPDFSIRCDQPKQAPVVVFSDASYSPASVDEQSYGVGGVAFVMYIPDSKRLLFAAATVPQSVLAKLAKVREEAGMCAQETFITDLESIAIAAVYMNSACAKWTFDRQVLHFADNQAANAGFIKGYSSAPNLARVVSATHLRWARNNINVWVEYVRSAQNIADLPSRWSNDELIALGGVEVTFEFPDVEAWSE
jgi:hypothetical protein